MQELLLLRPEPDLAGCEKSCQPVPQTRHSVVVPNDFVFLGRPLASTMVDVVPKALESVPDHQLTVETKQPDKMAFDKQPAQTAIGILDILERYCYTRRDGELAEKGWLGKLNFIPAVQGYVEAGMAVRMIIPAFPFKSPNKVDKVLGRLPDLGEELALAHLNGLCETIREAYGPGAEITVVSDGVVYNDLLGVSNEEVWDYGEALRAMAVAKKFRNIKFVRIGHLLGGYYSDTLTKHEYLTHAGCYRRELIAKFEDPTYNPHEHILNDKDTCLTYRGYLKFLFHDLKYSSMIEPTWSHTRYKKYVKEVATAMIVRGKVFAEAVRSRYSDHVRLSIHPSIGKTKLPVQLIPQGPGRFAMTPWHCSIAIGANGFFQTVHAVDVAKSHDLVHQDGRSYCLREKSELYDWGAPGATMEHLYPCGLIIRPGSASIDQPVLTSIDVMKLCRFAELQSPIIVRGFSYNIEQNLVSSNAVQLSKVTSAGCSSHVPAAMESHTLLLEHWATLNWKGFEAGLREIELVDSNKFYESPANEDVSSSLHGDLNGDGSTEFKEPTPGCVQPIKAPYIADTKSVRLFSYVESKSPRSQLALFASSRLCFQYLPSPYTADELEGTSWRMNVSDQAGHTSHMMTAARHPIHGTLYLRRDALASTAHVTTPKSCTPELAKLMNQLLHDRRVCLRLTMEKGDLVVYDTSAVLAFGPALDTNAVQPQGVDDVRGEQNGLASACGLLKL